MQDTSSTGNVASSPEPAWAAVAAARCADYELEIVRAALREVLAPLGGMAAFVKPGERIALKPNLLMPAAPERAIATHPAVVAAVALEVMEAGAHPVVVESPGTGVAACQGGHRAGLPQDRLHRDGGASRLRAQPRHGVPDGVGAGRRLLEALRSDEPHPAGRRRHQPGQVQDAHVHDLHRSHQEPVRGGPGAQQGFVSRPAGRSPALRRHAARRGLLRAAPAEHRRWRTWPSRATDRARAASRDIWACCWPASTR